MRTTLVIDADTLKELMRLEPGLTQSEALRLAVREHVRRKRHEEFIALAGSGLVDMDWKEAERRELSELKRRGRKR